MRRTFFGFGFALVIALVSFSRAEVAPEVKTRLTEDLKYLASDDLEGRGVGTKGLDVAAEFVSKAFREAGLDVRFEDPVLWPHRVHGLFCGMGVCNECLVTVDSQQSKRACMTKVAGSHKVTRQSEPVGLAASDDSEPPLLASDLPVRTPDLLVIGGGAGGINSAAIAAEAGLSVVL